MDEERLDRELKNAIIAYFEGYELVEYMQVSVEDIIELLEEHVLDNITDIKEEIGYNNDTDEDD